MIEITDWEIPELKWFQNRNETQLLHYFEPEPGIFIAESPNVILRALEAMNHCVSSQKVKRRERWKNRCWKDAAGSRFMLPRRKC